MDRSNSVRAFTSVASAARNWASSRSRSSGRTPARKAWRSARARSSWPCSALSRAWNSSGLSWAITAFLVTLCPSLTGKLTSKPDTWNASSTLFEASTLPGNERTLDSAPADTTIVLTGRTTSALVVLGARGEHPEARTTIESAIGTARPNALGEQLLAFTSTSFLPSLAARSSGTSLGFPDFQ